MNVVYKNKSYIFAVDFDGTIVEHRYPDVGAPVPGAIEFLTKLNQLGHRIILYTMRSGLELEAAVNYLKRNGIDLWGINENPSQTNWTQSPKIFAHFYIDDAAVGCPLIASEYRDYVNWECVEKLIPPSVLGAI